MVRPIVVQEIATLAVVTPILAARPQMENVARTSLETRPVLVPSLGHVVPRLVIVEVPVTTVLDQTAIAVLARSVQMLLRLGRGVSQYIYIPCLSKNSTHF